MKVVINMQNHGWVGRGRGRDGTYHKNKTNKYKHQERKDTSRL